MSFQNISKEIVKGYLSNVTFIDDRIFNGGVQVSKVAKKDVLKPGRGQSLSIQKEEVVERKNTAGFSSSELIKAFASEGIHCSLCEYVDENSQIVFTPLLMKSDVSIIDWELEIGDSSVAESIIEEILVQDQKKSPSLRLIVIYTNSTDINAIIADNISPLLVKLEVETTRKNDYSIIAGHTKIVVLAKEKISGIEGLEDYTVKEVNLPERIISEFTEITAGIVSNAALKSISLIRNHTHNLLGILNKTIDPGILAHKALLPHPEDFSGYIQDLIKGEICSVIESDKVEEVLSDDKVTNWISRNFAELSQKIKVNDTDYRLEEKSITEIAQKGLFKSEAYAGIINTQAKDLGLKSKEKRKHREACDKEMHKNLTSLFNPNGVSSTDIDLTISAINSLKHNIALGIKPKLGFGTIIIDETGNYWLCIQPKCDCVRIKRETSFFFLALDVENGKGAFDIVLNDGKEFKKIRVVNKVTKAKQIGFVGDLDREIVFATTDEEFNYTFQDTSDKKYYWKGELKTEYAQRIANSFAAQIARVGTDEYEWLRRS